MQPMIIERDARQMGGPRKLSTAPIPYPCVGTWAPGLISFEAIQPSGAALRGDILRRRASLVATRAERIDFVASAAEIVGRPPAVPKLATRGS